LRQRLLYGRTKLAAAHAKKLAIAHAVSDVNRPRHHRKGGRSTAASTDHERTQPFFRITAVLQLKAR
jgi:hypothetical protein